MGAPWDLRETVETSPAPAAHSDLVAGTTLGKYRLERVLGSGGVGVVWAAHDPDLERTVALKVLRSGGASNELRTRLLREARAMARLKHPNVLTVYEVGSQGDRDFIAMELVEGESLDAWLMTEPSRSEVWHAIISAGRGLAAAHRAGLVHRDFKPQNVLRGRDGRVLVTDFGLARTHDTPPPAPPRDAALATPRAGPAERTAFAITLDASPPPSGLDGPLTQTGALLGTPAYMAPEQYAGAGSDPRTDQFAFCVTAWQLLAGRRPFEGDTLEELRRAVSGGPINARGDLPRWIRRVLVRGLDADAAQRWPDMNALLTRLERAWKWSRRLPKGAVVATVATGIVVAIVLTRSTTQDGGSCAEAPEAAIARAWPAAVRATVLAKFASTRDIGKVVGTFDAWTAQWEGEYRATCARPRTKQTFAKLGCLLAELDVVASLAETLPNAPRETFVGAEMGGRLPRTEACAGDAPMTLPGLPDSPDKRAQIKQLRPRLLAAVFGDPQQMLPKIPDLIKEAEGIGWDPLLAEAHQAFAITARNAQQQWELARDHYKTASMIARRAHHYHLEADTTIGLLDGEIDAATDPADEIEFINLLAQAHSAVDNAGKDPSFIARLLALEAKFDHSRGRVDDAIAKLDTARATELAAGHHAAAIRYTKDDALARLQRDAPSDLAGAWQLLGETERAVASAGLADGDMSPLWSTQKLVAQLRGDLASSHAYGDRHGPPVLDVPTVTVTGRVVDGANRPVSGATVVAWTGPLEGDATRAYVHTLFRGALTTTDASGNFTLRAPRDGGIIAELGDRRSSPRAIAGAPLALVLESTRAVAGTVASDGEPLAGVLVIARYVAGDKAVWVVAAPVSRAGAYRLGGLPPGDAQVQLTSVLDLTSPTRRRAFGPPRDGAELRWPTGGVFDVIVRGHSDDPEIALLRGRFSPKTRADMTKLMNGASEFVLHQALVIGIGDQTLAGMPLYRRGDHHGMFVDTAPGLVTACVAGPAPEDRATCKTVDIPKTAPTEVRHGHGMYPDTAVVLDTTATR